MTNDILDIKGLVPVPGSWWWLWLVAGIVVVLVILYFIMRRLQRRDRPAIPPRPSIVVPPHEIALRALEQLRQDDPETEPFYTRLSLIVRQYLEGRFHLRAPERTTEEFLREVSADNLLSTDHKRLLGEFLQEADMVKFARHQPVREDRERAFEAARRFVLDTSLSPAVAAATSSSTPRPPPFTP